MVVGKEVKEAFVTADFDASKLESVPAFSKHLLDVSFIHIVDLSVLMGAVGAQERPEPNVAVRRAIPLAVDAERIEFITLDQSLEEITDFLCLWISKHRRGR